MQVYQRVWLEAHPERNRLWLQRAIAEGFQIHHVDGNHHNNHPDNLVLIEGVDHHRLHGRRVNGVVNKPRDLVLGEIVYRLKCNTLISWDRVAAMLDISLPRVLRAAHDYADLENKPWPLPKAIKTPANAYKRPVYRGY